MDIFSTILYVAGGVSIVVSAIFSLYKLALWVRKPSDTHTNILNNKAEISNIKLRLNNDDTRLKNIESDVSMILKVLVGLLEHTINGADSEQLKHVRDELVNHIVKF